MTAWNALALGDTAEALAVRVLVIVEVSAAPVLFWTGSLGVGRWLARKRCAHEEEKDQPHSERPHGGTHPGPRGVGLRAGLVVRKLDPPTRTLRPSS